MTTKNKSDLSVQKELFCNEYIIDFNATQAAIRAGYSKKTANQQGPKLLVSVGIKEKISQLINDKLGTEKDELRLKILKELNTIAFANVTNDVNVVSKTIDSPLTGKPTDIQIVEIQDTEKSKQSAAIAEIKQNEKGVITIKYHDKVKSLELLGKFGAMWTDKVEHTGSVIYVIEKEMQGV